MLGCSQRTCRFLTSSRNFFLSWLLPLTPHPAARLFLLLDQFQNTYLPGPAFEACCISPKKTASTRCHLSIPIKGHPQTQVQCGSSGELSGAEVEQGIPGECSGARSGTVHMGSSLHHLPAFPYDRLPYRGAEDIRETSATQGGESSQW